MKIKSLLLGATGLGLGLSAQAQTTKTVDIVGATAFRSAAHSAIMAAYGGNLTGLAYDVSSTDGPAKASRVTYRGTFPGITGTTVIRVSWSGSVEGVRSLDSLTAPADKFIPMGNATSKNGVPGITTTVDGLKTAAIAFSDVAQSNTPFTRTTLFSTQVGVIAFAPVINKGANPAISNITSNQLRRIATNGFIPVSMLTGNASNNGTIYLMGRNDGSGTRVAFLSEIGLGATNPVKHWVVNATTSNSTLSNPILAPTTTNSTLYPKYSLSTDFTKNNIAGNGGYSSGGTIAGWMQKPSSGNFNMVSWLGTPDAITAYSSGTGGRVLAYNGEKLDGVAAGAWTDADRNKIRLGKYSAWTFQNLFIKPGLLSTSPEWIVYNALVARIPGNIGTAGVANDSSFKVTRTTDGGVIAPK